MMDQGNIDSIVCVDFKYPIVIRTKINVIEERYLTEFKSQLFVSGSGNFGELKDTVEFFCPPELEFLIHDKEVKVGDNVEIRFYGNVRKEERFVKQFNLIKLGD